MFLEENTKKGESKPMNEKFFLPEEKRLVEIMISVSDNPGLVEKMYPDLSKKLAGKQFTLTEISKTVLKASDEYLSNEGLDQYIGPWLMKIATEIVSKLSQEKTLKV